MARSGWSTANFLRCGSAVMTAYPITLAAWAKSSITGSQQAIFGLYNSASAEYFYLAATTSNAAAMFVTGEGVPTSTTYTTGTWNHFCVSAASATSRSVYLNGGGKASSATNITPSGLNRTSLGVRDDSTGPSEAFAPAGTGSLAEAVAWNVALTDADVANLALGIHPFLVRPDKLVAYWDVLGYNSPETNRKSNSATMAIQGALSQSAHTRVFYPAIGPQRRRLKAGSLANATSLIHMSPVFG